MSLSTRRILAFTLALFPALAACDGDPSGPRVLGCNDIAALNFDREATVAVSEDVGYRTKSASTMPVTAIGIE